MNSNYLDKLNENQRAAVVFGVEPAGQLPPPLLVIAGAGSGKTSTLAHRVAHILVNGADPRRILLPSAVGGAIFLSLADMLTRIPFPGGELRLGVVVAMSEPVGVGIPTI